MALTSTPSAENHADLPTRARHAIGEWIRDLRIGGSALPHATRAELLAQLAAASAVRARDGGFEVVLPALSSLGVGIFQRSFRCDAVRVRVVPYGDC